MDMKGVGITKPRPVDDGVNVPEAQVKIWLVIVLHPLL